jgi:hypothetical protein
MSCRLRCHEHLSHVKSVVGSLLVASAFVGAWAPDWVTQSEHRELPRKLPRFCAAGSELWRSLAIVISDQFESDTPVFPVFWPEYRPSPIVTDRPRPSQISGPAHHRTSAENDYFYRLFANSNIAVTPKVTPFHSARDSGRNIDSIWPAERLKPSSLDSF